MDWAIPVITCVFVAVVAALLAYDFGRHVQGYKDGELIQKAMQGKNNVEIYEDHENAETTIFINLENEPAYPVKAIITNDGEALKLYQEAREI